MNSEAMKVASSHRLVCGDSSLEPTRSPAEAGSAGVNTLPREANKMIFHGLCDYRRIMGAHGMDDINSVSSLQTRRLWCQTRL